MIIDQDNAMNFDTTKLFLGNLCSKGHDWNNTGKSLRLKNNHKCLECRDQYNSTYKRAFRENNREKYLQQKREAYQRNKAHHLARCNDYKKINREKVLSRKKEHYWNNRDKYLVASRNWRQNNKELVNHYSRERRARKKQAHRVNFTVEQKQEHYNKFNNSCAYCNTQTTLTPDHFLPLSQGGSDVLGNIVPACLRCNISKNDSDPREWYKRQVFFSKERWQQILKILGKSETSYQQIPLF